MKRRWLNAGDGRHLVPVGLGVVLAEVRAERLERLRLLLLEEPEEAPELRPPPRHAPGPPALVRLAQLAHRLPEAQAERAAGNGGAILRRLGGGGAHPLPLSLLSCCSE